MFGPGSLSPRSTKIHQSKLGQQEGQDRELGEETGNQQGSHDQGGQEGCQDRKEAEDLDRRVPE